MVGYPCSSCDANKHHRKFILLHERPDAASLRLRLEGPKARALPNMTWRGPWMSREAQQERCLGTCCTLGLTQPWKLANRPYNLRSCKTSEGRTHYMAIGPSGTERSTGRDGIFGRFRVCICSATERECTMLHGRQPSSDTVSPAALSTNTSGLIT